MANALLVSQSGGFSEVALFSAADRYRFLLIFVPLSVSRIAVPALSRFRSAGDDDAYRQTFRWSIGFVILATVPPVIGCVALSPWLMSLFGQSFARGWPTLSILAI